MLGRDSLIRKMPIVLPHDLLNALHKSGRLQSMCPEEELSDFWDNYREHTSDEIAWPAGRPTDDCVPLGVHGDDCRFTDSGQKLIVISLNILLDPWKDRFPMAVIRYVTWANSIQSPLIFDVATRRCNEICKLCTLKPPT